MQALRPKEPDINNEIPIGEVAPPAVSPRPRPTVRNDDVHIAAALKTPEAPELLN